MVTLRSGYGVGPQVWSKSFAAPVNAANLLSTQDEISGTASAMIGSYWGAIGVAEFKRIQAKSSAELTPYECIVQGVIGTSTDVTIAEPIARARDCLERLTRNEPGNAAAWAALVLVFNSQRKWGIALPAEEAASVDKRLYLATNALAAANHAIELAPNDAFVRGLAARAAWMACKPDQVRIETNRAIALNPNDPQTFGPLGTLMAASGYWDEGASLAEKGIALTAPSTPRWWWWAIAKRHWFRGEHRQAFCRATLAQPSADGIHAAAARARRRSQATRCVGLEAATRIHDPRGGRLLRHVVLQSAVPRKDA
jgi:tetratricopeptide (TPR) repeat protein